MDPLSQVLQLMNLKGCVYFNAEFRAPWGMTIPKSNFAQFHMVQQGTCRIELAGAEQILSTGDVVVFPQGDAHKLYEGAPVNFVSGIDVLNAIASGREVFTEGSHITTRILCGHFEIDRSSTHPLLSGLPKQMIVRGFDQESMVWSTQLAELLLREQEKGMVGSSEIVVRLAESLFIQVLRAYMENDKPVRFLAALSDDRLRRALEIIHSSPSSELTLDGLAKQIGMSRSSLAERFKSAVGMSPMKYLSAWKLMKAQKLLESTNKPISIIAEKSGYTSEAAFSRAFKSYVGVPPSTFRRQKASAAAE